MEIPTPIVWGNSSDLDEAYARKRFMGRSLTEAVEIFRCCPTSGAEDLFNMPPLVLAYYLEAFEDSVRSLRYGDMEKLVVPNVVIYMINMSAKRDCEWLVARSIDMGEFVMVHRKYFEMYDDEVDELASAVRAAKERWAR